jgi:hypothetical protein
VSDPLVQEIVADVNGNSRADRIQTRRGAPKPGVLVGESVVQVAFDTAGIELVVSNAQRASGEPGSSNVPPLTDDLVFAWTLERYQLRDGVMVSVDSRQGTARHADLPVPKRQGFNCAAGI